MKYRFKPHIFYSDAHWGYYPSCFLKWNQEADKFCEEMARKEAIRKQQALYNASLEYAPYFPAMPMLF